MEHWPWWLGAIAMSGTALGYLLVVRRPLGISGALGTALSPGARQDEAAAAGVDDKALEEAMIAATLAAFPDAAQQVAQVAPADGCDVAPASAATGLAPSLGWGRSAAFLVGLMFGGVVFSLVSHAPNELLATGTYARFFGDGASSLIALFVGGIFVGAGTSMAGGCTSGHGLVGVARFQPGSLVATASFFGTAIAVSLLLASVLS